MSLRELIRFVRTNYRLSQDVVAKAVKGESGKSVTRNYINMIENNTGNVYATEERLTEILNTIYKIGEKKIKNNLTNKELMNIL